MSTMKAWRLHSYGGPECLQLNDAPLPKPGPSQILVATSHVGMNPFDWKIREGHVKDMLPLELPTTLGVDFVGTVAALGEGCSSRLKVGDRVMTMSTSLGAFAEYIAVEESILAKVPDAVSDASAATLPIPALSAWTALHTAGELLPGMKILVHGASGIVGAFAVQFAKAAGATVLGTASGKNREFVEALGLDTFVDYQTEKFEEVAKDVDLVVDFVLVGGSQSTTDRSWAVLKKGGAIVTLADPTIMGKIPEEYHGYFPQVKPDVAVLEKVAKQLAGGEVSSKIAKVFPRGELVHAMEMNKAGGTTGRLIVNFREACGVENRAESTRLRP